MSFLLFLACASEEVQYEFGKSETSAYGEETDRPQENIPASVVGDADLANGDQIHERSCLACHPDSAPSFDYIIPEVTDLAIETAIRDGKKGVPAALGERSPPDGALRLNLTDQDIIDVIAFVRQEYGEYQP